MAFVFCPYNGTEFFVACNWKSVRLQKWRLIPGGKNESFWHWWMGRYAPCWKEVWETAPLYFQRRQQKQLKYIYAKMSSWITVQNAHSSKLRGGRFAIVEWFADDYENRTVFYLKRRKQMEKKNTYENMYDDLIVFVTQKEILSHDLGFILGVFQSGCRTHSR